MASEGRRLTRNRRSRLGTWPPDGSSVSLGVSSLGLSMQASEGWANLPATTRPPQRVQPEAARSRVATGSDRQSGGLADRGERGVTGVQLCALFRFHLLATWTVAASRIQPLSGPSHATACAAEFAMHHAGYPM
jgi:hypothetical protein